MYIYNHEGGGCFHPAGLRTGSFHAVKRRLANAITKRRFPNRTHLGSVTKPGGNSRPPRSSLLARRVKSFR